MIEVKNRSRTLRNLVAFDDFHGIWKHVMLTKEAPSEAKLNEMEIKIELIGLFSYLVLRMPGRDPSPHNKTDIYCVCISCTL